MALTPTPTDSFPHAELTAIPIGTQPDFLQLKVIHQELNANAMSIPSTRGGGNHGHLALVINTAQFNAITGTIPWEAPTHPGAAPVHVPMATAPQITETNQAYRANLEEFSLYAAIQASLKKQLIAAIPETYIKSKKDDMIGYANVTTLELLTHLDTAYGTVTNDDLQANEKAMGKEWSPTQPLEDLWNQILACKKYAQPHDPISERKMIRSALANLENSGVFSHGMTKWREKDTADQTWANLLTHFAKQVKEQQHQLTASDAGYAGAVLGDRTNAVNNNAQGAAGKPAPLVGATLPMYYCWSHGLTTSHSSKTCNNRQPGYRDEAIVDNM